MNQLKITLMLVVASFLLLQSCQPTTATVQVKTPMMNMDSVKMKIQDMENAYAKATLAKDVDGVAAYYAADAQSLANNETTRTGMDAIKAGIKKEMANDTLNHTIAYTTTGVWAGGDYVTETGISTVKDKDGKVVYTGKYMTLFEMRNGKYVAIRDIWNDDMKAMDKMPAMEKPVEMKKDMKKK